MGKSFPTPIEGSLRKQALKIPPAIRHCSGIIIFGKRIKSLVFSTDLAIINNIDADAVLAVHPFTPQPKIIQGILTTSDIPVFAGVGGGLTKGARLLQMAMSAEIQGAIGVIVNSPTDNATVEALVSSLEIPVVVTVVNEYCDISGRIASGATILNISAAENTPAIVSSIRARYPYIPIIATGGPTEDTIMATVAAGANAITWTPPSTAELFAETMALHRKTQACMPTNCG